MTLKAPGESISTDLQKSDIRGYNGDVYWAVFTYMGTLMRFFFSFKIETDIKMAF